MTIPAQPSWWATKFRDLPLLQLAPLMDDTDVEFAGTMMYLRGMLDSIVDAAVDDGYQPPPLLDVQLNAYAGAAWAALDELRCAETTFAEVIS